MTSTRRRASSTYYKTVDGRFNIELLGTSYSSWQDPYHLLLTMSWGGFLGLTGVFYLISNALFACAYLLGGNSIAGARPGSFWDAFFFSVQTMATIGYGRMSPQTFYANTLVTLEALVGLLGIAMGTGLMFSRFARPTAKVLFSQFAVIAPHDGVPTLMFRAANERLNQILEAQMRVNFLRDEVTAEGQFIRRIYDLKLIRSRTPAFTLSWLVLHSIDEHSPLYGETAESLAEGKVTFLVTLTGIDETVAQAIHARHSYSIQEVLWNAQLVDIFSQNPEGHRTMDYRRFHDVEAIEQGAGSGE